MVALNLTSEYKRAMALEARLLSETGFRGDVLAKYRVFLDRLHIEAEDIHGWPSEDAYNEANIKAFISQRTSP